MSVTMTPVKSSACSSIGYDAAARELHVQYGNGAPAIYADVSPEKHAALMAAPSIGKHLHAHIKGTHAHRRGA